MRKLIAGTLIVSVTFISSISNAVATPTLGGKCSPVGNFFGSGSKKMVCALVKKKLVWAKVPVSKSKPITTSSSSPKSAQPTANNSPKPAQPSASAINLPLLTTFSKNLSPVFPVDFSKGIHTIPFLGVAAKNPHPGLHVHWSNMDGEWTNTGGKDHVTSYPVVRAFEDGIVEKVTPLYTMSTSNGNGHQKYGIILGFAVTADGSQVMADYSMEPLIMEPSPHFYEAFILVKEGQRVKRGDIMAYMYIPPSSSGGTHVHFNLIVSNQPISPSLFTPDVVKAFSAKYLDKSWLASGAILPESIGYGLSAAENPFANKAVDNL